MGTGPEIFSAHYNVALLRGDAGDSPYAEWAKRARAETRRESLRAPNERLLQRIVPLEQAVDTVASFATWNARRPRRPGATNGRSQKDVQDDFNRGRQLVQAAVLEGYLVSTRPADTKVGRVAPRLDGTAPTLYDGLRKKLGVADSVVAAARNLLAASPGMDEATAAVRALLSPITSFTCTPTIDGCGKSTVAVSGTSTDVQPFSTYAVLMDPRSWSVDSPDTFKASYGTIDLDPQSVLDTPTALQGMPPVGQTYNSTFYEVAGLDVFTDVSITEFRNILNVAFTNNSGAAPPTLQLDYSLYESLTTSVYGITHQAGIDADSGFGRTTVEASSVKMECSKGIRFSPAAPLSVALNIVILPWLVGWLTTVVVDGLTL